MELNMRSEICPFRWRPLCGSLALTLGLVGLALLASCNWNSGSQTSTDPPGEIPAVRTGKPLFDGWSEPRAVLVLTGDEHGYLEPCGCSEKQSGGLARRGDLLRQIREERNWPVTAFNVGGTLYEPRVAYPQSKIKFSIFRKGLEDLGYQGLALGLEELMLGPETLYTEHLNSESQEGFDLPFLAANVTLFGSRDLGMPQSFRVVDVGGVKVGVAAVSGQSTRQKLDATGLTQDENSLRIDDPQEVLPAVLEELKVQNPDLLVLLSHASMEESQQLAAAFPEFHIVVTAGSPEDPRPEPEWVGETLLVQVGKKGKHAAVVGLFPDDKLRMELVELDMDRFSDLPAMRELMRDYQQRLRENWEELTQDSIPDPSAGSFVGVDECKTCHTFAYNVWKNTYHARAYDSLIKGRPGQEETWIARIHDPECLACHTVGWDQPRALRYDSGFIDMAKTPHLAGQQCENCHGPGSNHVSLENAVKAGAAVDEAVLSGRKSMQLTLTRARNEVCNRCHDLDNSPHFDFDKYWPKVNHSGRKD